MGFLSRFWGTHCLHAGCLCSHHFRGFCDFEIPLLSNHGFSQERKISPKRNFAAGHPCGHPPKNFGQALQILENKAFWHGHSVRTSTKKLRSEKLRAEFSFPIFGNKKGNPPKTLGFSLGGTLKVFGDDMESVQKEQENPRKQISKSKEWRVRSLVSRGRCGREIARLRRPAAMVAASCLRL